MKLNIQKFSGGGTGTALEKVNTINNAYGDAVDQIESTWNKIDTWGTQYASGGQFKTTMQKTAEAIEGIPQPSGNNVNGYLQERTDKIIADANREDQVHNEGRNQVSNPFEQRSISCSVSVPDTRPYKGIDDFTGFTDEGVAEISEIKKYITELQSKIDEIFKLMGSNGSIGVQVTGADMQGSFEQDINKNTDVLTESINALGTAVDSTVQAQEQAGSTVQTY